MKITNRLNLPSAFVKMAESEYEYKPKRYSVTSLLKPIKEIILSRRYHHEAERDVSEMIWLLFGQAVHYILEHHDESGFAEMKLEYKLKNGYTVSGIIDLYNQSQETVVDYKTASVNKVMGGDFLDWQRQAHIYCWLLRMNGFKCKKAVFYAIFKDHSMSKYKEAQRRGDFYPEHPIMQVEFSFNNDDFKAINKYIRAKLADIIATEPLNDDQLPECTDEERWATQPKWAVYKHKGAARASRVLDTESEARDYMEANKCGHLEFRAGESRRCLYCSAKQFCDFYLSSGDLTQGD